MIDMTANELNSMSQRAYKTHDDYNLVLKILEFVVWGGFGWAVALHWGVLLGIVGYFIVSKRPMLIGMKLDANELDIRHLVRLAGCLIFLSYVLTFFSFSVVLTEVFVLYKNVIENNDMGVSSAKTRLEAEQDKLTVMLKNPTRPSDMEVSEAIRNHQKLTAELATAKATARTNHAAEINAWEANKTAFWSTVLPLKTGGQLIYHQIMSAVGTTCTAKTSPFKQKNGRAPGKLTTYTNRICPKWQTIWNAQPAGITGDPEVVRILDELNKTKSVLAYKNDLEIQQTVISDSFSLLMIERTRVHGTVPAQDGINLLVNILRGVDEDITMNFVVALVILAVVWLFLGTTYLSSELGERARLLGCGGKERKKESIDDISAKDIGWFTKLRLYVVDRLANIVDDLTRNKASNVVTPPANKKSKSKVTIPQAAKDDKSKVATDESPTSIIDTPNMIRNVVTPFQPTKDDEVPVVKVRKRQIGFIQAVSTKQVDLFSQYPTS